MPKLKSHGFTLIELMIVVAVVAIITAVAYPSYQQYVKRVKRTEVQSYLMELSHKLTSYKLVNRNYRGVDLAGIGGESVFPDLTQQNYTIVLKDDAGVALGSGAENGTTWLLTAIPANSQTGDGAVTLDHNGQKCWFRGKDSPTATDTCSAWSDK
ncbi:prepilin-type N-terminal cleavage/methylation domain-containing protein [Acinetobacter chinensis]|uniref:Prepilin-type N-terminal cleavage/methylation domain-containing protein n=1 Tax=Acinetobacter chinensis TaxID=2004650 RepID=A0A3B7M5R5_9GAMM|nr:type IV pilin protein [Acinetobacter chinensis]AXY58013.1 prepilin-type N-terminal cleavage/methylation domain-containing protein [Acinetobacter chinensis]